MTTPKRFSRLRVALEKGDEKFFPRPEYPSKADSEIPETTLRPPHESFCKTCYGIGWYTLNVAVTDERFGKRIKCTDPECKAQDYLRRQRQSNLENAYSYNDAGEDYEQYTFDSWLNLPFVKQRGKELPLLAARRVAHDPFAIFTLADLFGDWGKPYKVLPAREDSDNPDERTERVAVGDIVLQNNYGNWLVFEGGYGTGKTGLAMAALNEAKRQGHYAVFVRLPDYIEAWQRTYNYTDAGEREDAQRQLSAPLIAADLLLVDEVNVAEDTSGRASHDKIRIFTDYIISPRHKEGARKPTILTTNKNADSFMTHWGERIASRVFERAHWFTFRGEAMRHQNRPI